MNREIKFRGKSKLNGKWVYGDLIHEAFIHTKKVPLAIKEYGIIPTEVDPKTVGQYTGLKDVNGVEIYEGDIVEYQSNGLFKSVVSWGKKSHAWTLKTDRTNEKWGTIKYYKLPVSKCIKVIGNIHSNSELLNA